MYQNCDTAWSKGVPCYPDPFLPSMLVCMKWVWFQYKLKLFVSRMAFRTCKSRMTVIHHSNARSWKLWKKQERGLDSIKTTLTLLLSNVQYSYWLSSSLGEVFNRKSSIPFQDDVGNLLRLPVTKLVLASHSEKPHLPVIRLMTKTSRLSQISS